MEHFAGVNNDKCFVRRDNNHPNGMKRAQKFPGEGEKERFHLPDGIREPRRNNLQVMLDGKRKILSRGNVVNGKSSGS
jgi:hypothetical protein